MLIVKCKKVKRFSKHILHKPILSYTLTRLSLKFQEYRLDAIIRRRIELLESGFAFIFPLFPLKVSGVMFMVVREIPGPCSHRCPLMEYCSNLEHYKKTVRNKWIINIYNNYCWHIHCKTKELHPSGCRESQFYRLPLGQAVASMY